jgi:ABC-type lipoprotein release transport system permease subunit
VAVPLKYNVRNLLRRKARTALTVGGIAVTVFVIVVTLALMQGMWGSVSNTAAPDNILLLSRKGQTAIQSQIEGTDAALLETLPAVKRNAEGVGYISPELIYMITVTFDEHPEVGRVKARIRGIDPQVAFLVHDQVRVREKDRARGVTGPQKNGGILVGANAHIRLGVPKEWLGVGRSLWFGKKPPNPKHDQGKLTIIGHFEAPGTAYQTEIWFELEDLKALVEVRKISAIALKVQDPKAVPATLDAVHRREDVKLDGLSEKDYFADYYESLNSASVMIVLICLVVCGGGVLVGMNTMYTAVMGRIREIGTLKVLGYRSEQVLLSFLVESALISGASGVLGTAAAFLLPLLFQDFRGLTVFQTSFQFRISPEVAAAGVAAALVMGVVGAFPPALKGVRMKVVDALRSA